MPHNGVTETVDHRHHSPEADDEGRAGLDELPGTNPREQPGIPDEPIGPAEGGD